MEFTGKRGGTKGAQHASLYCCLLTLPTSGTMPSSLLLQGASVYFQLCKQMLSQLRSQVMSMSGMGITMGI